MSDSPAVIIYDSSGNPVKLFDLDTGAGIEHSLGISIRLPSSGGSVAGGTNTNPIRVDPTGTTIQPISVTSLPLPAGAATEVTLASLLTSSTFTSRINTLGQKTMSNSMPVVIASDQSTLSVSGTVSVTQSTNPWVISAASLPLPNGAATEITLAALLTSSTFTARINTFGQKTMDNSTPVTLASDQSTLPVSIASIPLPNGAATESTLATRLADSTFTGRINTFGQKTMANSTPIVIASDQSALPVTGTITTNIGTTNGLALDTTLTGGTQKSIVRGGAKGSTTAADVTSTSVDVNTQALHVQLAAQGTAIVPLRIDPTGTTTQPISAASLPLPADAATETTLSTLLTEVTFTNRINTLGQKVMAASTPVAIASDQGPIAIDGYVIADIGDTNGLALDTTINTLLKETTFTNRINTLGQKTMSQSTPVVLASNQSALPVTIVDGEAGGGVQKTLYDIGDTDIYIGTAAQGTASSAALWLIKKTTLDMNGNPVSTLYSSDMAIWDNRLTESYS